MFPLSNPSQWADSPFNLIQTPKFKNGQTAAYTDDYTETASTMAIVHNCIIRSLNTIYLQAPHLPPSEYKNFIGYCYCWFEVVEGHHHGEEQSLFPKIEDATGEEGLMNINREQHDLFLPGLIEYKSYLLSLKDRELDFSGERLCGIIDSFAEIFRKHLEDEISSLLSLAKYENKLPLGRIWEDEGKNTMMLMSKAGGLPFFFFNLDRTYENHLWKNWPPAPAPVGWMVRNVFSWWNYGYWKFASCDANGFPRPLLFLEGNH